MVGVMLDFFKYVPAFENLRRALAVSPRLLLIAMLALEPSKVFLEFVLRCGGVERRSVDQVGNAIADFILLAAVPAAKCRRNSEV